MAFEWTTIGKILGGLGIFLLGLDFMQSGFKTSAGPAMRRIIAEHTQSRLKGVLAGFVVSSSIQSATAIMLTLIQFMNAQILRLRQAVPIVLGSNLGKITTAWLITLAGLKVDLTGYALPFLGIGVLIRSLLKRKWKGYGEILIGFACVFLGISILKTNTSLVATQINFRALLEFGIFTHVFFFLCGVILAVITQSSSAGLAIALSAVSSGLIDLPHAAEIMIGLNLGTTSSTYFASLSGAPNARRLAATHVFFNLLCAVSGVILLAVLTQTSLLSQLDPWARAHPIIGLTCYYTAFILTAMLAFLPFSNQWIIWLKRHMYRTNGVAGPKYINPATDTKSSPLRATQLLEQEVVRFGNISANLLSESINWKIKKGWVYSEDLSNTEEQLDVLNEFIHKFAAGYTKSQKTDEELINRIQQLLRAVQHFSLSASYSESCSSMKSKLTTRLDKDLLDTIQDWCEDVDNITNQISEAIEQRNPEPFDDLKSKLTHIDDIRRNLRYDLVHNSLKGDMKSTQASLVIDILENSRRALKELIKGFNKLWKQNTFNIEEFINWENANQNTVASEPLRIGDKRLADIIHISENKNTD